MPFSHFKMVESYDWTTNLADVIARYQVPSTSGSITFGPGRFGGNSLGVAGLLQEMFQPVGGDVPPWGPDFTMGLAWFNAGSIPGNNAQIQIWHGPVGGGGSNPQFTLFLNNAGQIELHRGGGSGGTLLGTCSVVMLANTWYYVEVTVHIDPVAGTAAMQIDGVLQFNVSGVNTQGAPDHFYDSAIFFTVGFHQFNADDIYVKDTIGMLGERRVILNKPASDSAPLQWSPSAGVTHFNLVNEVPPDGDTSYVFSSTPGQIDTYGMAGLPYTPVTIDTVQTSMYLRKDDAGARQDSVMVNGTTSAIVITVTSSYNDYIEMWDVNPLTALPWVGTAVPATVGINEIA
jgi:hypothetical protein